MSAYAIDIAALMRQRLLSPQELRGEYGRDPAHEIGQPVIRQLTRPDSAPGGQKPMRLSELGQCLRRQAYKRLGFVAQREISAETKLTFCVGDMTEALILTVLREALACAPVEASGGWQLAGDRGAGGQQRKVILRLAGQEIDGHPDGFLGTSDGAARAVLEIKSMGGNAFRRTRTELDAGREPWTRDDSYYWQVQAYMAAINASREPERHYDYAYILGLSRDTGEIVGWWHKRDPEFVALATNSIGLVVEAQKPEDLPQALPSGEMLRAEIDLHKRTGEPNRGHGCLPWQCAYCPYLVQCRGPVENVIVSGRSRVRPAQQTDATEVV